VFEHIFRYCQVRGLVAMRQGMRAGRQVGGWVSLLNMFSSTAGGKRAWRNASGHAGMGGMMGLGESCDE
jgi:hypothetical protein